jgi:RecB family exonuclease
MIPETISPSSISTFESCPARFNAENIKVRDLGLKFHSNEAAKLGTACHGALDKFITRGLHLLSGNQFHHLEAAFVECYYDLFTSPDRYDEGVRMLQNWYNRTNFDGRQVISTELKRTIQVPYIAEDGSRQSFPLNYICDRVDMLEDKSIEIVDYKTITRPVSPEELKNKIQARIYALAAQIDYPDVDKIWVTYDLLRYQPVSTQFTRDDNKATWYYVKNVAQRIALAQGDEEIINDACRFCVRRKDCYSLNHFADISGDIFDESNLDKAMAYRYMAKSAMDALKQNIGQVDEVLATFLDENELTDTESDSYSLRLRTRSERRVDEDRAAMIAGPELTAKYGRFGIKELERLLDADVLTDSQRSQLKQLIRKDVSSSWIEVRQKHEAEFEDL